MNAEEALGAQVVIRSSLVAFVFLAYDTCLTFSDEVEHIWSKPHSSSTKWLFIVLRWFTLIALVSMLLPNTDWSVPSTSHCGAWYIFHSFAWQLVVGLMEVILAQRVYALYDQSRIVGGGLLIAFIAEQVVMAVSFGLAAPRVIFKAVCISMDAPPVVIGSALTPILYELTLLVLTLARLGSHARAIGWRRAPLLRLLVRDGLWAFLLVFAVFVINAMFYNIVSGPQNGLALAWQYAVAAFSGCRLVLNMHTDLALARGSALSPAPRPRAGAGTAGTSGVGQGTFALTTFVPTLSLDDEGVDSDEAGGGWGVETTRRSGVWSGRRRPAEGGKDYDSEGA